MFHPKESQVQAPTPSEGVNNMNIVLLIDIDDTFIIKDPKNKQDIYCDGIIHVIEDHGLTLRFLFSKADLPLYGRVEITRPELLEHLQEKKFATLGLITHLDPHYKKGLGAAYRDLIAPVLLKKTDPGILQVDTKHPKFAEYKKAIDQCLDLHAMESTRGEFSPFVEKGPMFRYFIQESRNLCGSIIVIDDNASVIQGIALAIPHLLTI